MSAPGERTLLPDAETLRHWLAWLEVLPPWVQMAVAGVLVLLAAWLAHLLTRLVVGRLVTGLTTRVPSWWAGVVNENQVFQRLVPVVPVLVINRGILLVPDLPTLAVDFVQRVMLALMAVLVARAIGALINAAHAIYQRYPIARGRPIKGYVQVLKLIVYLLAGFMVIAALANQSPWFFISGLGAMTAILLLIFRDTILSFVAGIQLVNNDLVRVGDWIEMPQFNADGDVIDIALNVVRVQNFDRTIIVIPTHKFLEHSFRNWRGMFESGGRRIKRTVHLDLSTVRFLTPEEIARFRRFLLLKDYIETKERELAEWNTEHCPPDQTDILANTRHLTNIGTLRAYISEYLKRHPQIHTDRLFLIRQMEPTAKGVGIEVYVFAKDTRWVFYEAIQSDIFDHILAIVPEFGLRVFQEPTGADFARLGGPASDAT
ncbi:MAG: mechanosensitive ion channel family protein [Gammaproteobacteria bacterium]|nr:mechanosensitive ion channel family protein [Gammaproteobacteria bacterium]TVQ50333.1 MAG: mechanosensitive ion channel family protein [Gammaproteobacteria bacterium]